MIDTPSHPARSLYRALATSLLLAAGLAACASVPSAVQVQRDRLARAEAMFAERCKRAGVKIYRTAENVEGVFLMKVRPFGINYGENERQQFDLDDPYGRDSTGDEYVKSFVRITKGLNFRTGPESDPLGTMKLMGPYRYVEAIDPKDGKRYRYIGEWKVMGKKDVNAEGVQFELKRNPNYDINNYGFVLDKALAIGEPPRYGVTFDDLSTREEREYWIAGSSLRIIDLKTNEVMAERIGYMMDRAQGSRAGGRAPWLWAATYSCPRFDGGRSEPAFAAQPKQTRQFTQQILKPSQGK